MSWVKINAKWSDDAPKLWSVWYNTQRRVHGSNVHMLLDRGLKEVDLRKMVEHYHSSQGRGVELVRSRWVSFRLFSPPLPPPPHPLLALRSH